MSKGNSMISLRQISWTVRTHSSSRCLASSLPGLLAISLTEVIRWRTNNSQLASSSPKTIALHHYVDRISVTLNNPLCEQQEQAPSIYIVTAAPLCLVSHSPATEAVLFVTDGGVNRLYNNKERITFNICQPKTNQHLWRCLRVRTKEEHASDDNYIVSKLLLPSLIFPQFLWNILFDLYGKMHSSILDLQLYVTIYK